MHASPDVAAADLQRLENVLDDTPVPRATRRRLLQGAAAGIATVGVAGAPSAPPAATASRSDDPLGARNRGELRRHVPDGGGPARARARRRRRSSTRCGPRTRPSTTTSSPSKLGGVRFTTRFWIPEASFGGGGVGLFESIETADTVELKGYLTGVTAFARAGREPAARWLAEGCAIESEHRAIARFAQTALGGRRQISIDRSFAPWEIRTAAAMIAALEGAGIGFGRRGAGAGASTSSRATRSRTAPGWTTTGAGPSKGRHMLASK